MERRNFLMGLVALAAGSATLAVAGKAEAAPIAAPTDALREAGATTETRATLPDGTPIEQAQYRGPNYYRGRPRRRRREVCRVTRNRFGRPVRVCRSVWY